MFTAPVGGGTAAAVFLRLSVFLLLPPSSSSSDGICPPPPHVRVSYTKITGRFSGASIAALRHLPHLAVSPRPRELHTSHMEECTYMNINMQTTPPLQISLCHTCRVLLSRDGRLSWVPPPIPFLPLPSGPPLLFSFLFLSLLPSNSHRRLAEA